MLFFLHWAILLVAGVIFNRISAYFTRIKCTQRAREQKMKRREEKEFVSPIWLSFRVFKMCKNNEKCVCFLSGLGKGSLRITTLPILFLTPPLPCRIAYYIFNIPICFESIIHVLQVWSSGPLGLVYIDSRTATTKIT